jgi:hypothetical protein
MPLKTLVWMLGLAVIAPVSPGSEDASEYHYKCPFGCPGDGRKYRNALVDEIAAADRIVVTEHSDRMDAFDSKAGRSRIEGEFVYQTVELDPAQRVQFQKTIAKLDPATQNFASACLPVVHHTFFFYQGDSLKSRLDICFQCSQVDWNGIRGIAPPGSIYQGLKKAVTALGMQPKRDWQALARERLTELIPPTVGTEQ